MRNCSIDSDTDEIYGVSIHLCNSVHAVSPSLERNGRPCGRKIQTRQYRTGLADSKSRSQPYQSPVPEQYELHVGADRSGPKYPQHPAGPLEQRLATHHPHRPALDLSVQHCDGKRGSTVRFTDAACLIIAVPIRNTFLTATTSHNVARLYHQEFATVSAVSMKGKLE